MIFRFLSRANETRRKLCEMVFSCSDNSKHKWLKHFLSNKSKNENPPVFIMGMFAHFRIFKRGFKNSVWKGKVQFAYNVAICSFFFVGQCDTRCFLLIFWIFWSLLIDLLKWLLFLSIWPLNPLSANPSKWSNTLKQFVGCCQRIIWVSLIILWG